MSMRTSIVFLSFACVFQNTGKTHAQTPSFVAAINDHEFTAAFLAPVESKFLEILTVSCRPTYGISVGMSSERVYQILKSQGKAGMSAAQY
jgi:hypothetical protein